MNQPKLLSLAVALLSLCAGVLIGQEEKPEAMPEYVKQFEIKDLLEQRAGSEHAWLEFLDTDRLSCGIYALPKDGTDGQSPHTEDEIYYVLKGRAGLTVGTQELKVEPGSVVFVKRASYHRFHDIEEDLELLVFFAKNAEAK